MNNEFWRMLEGLVNSSEIIIDRPKGSAHPRFPQLIYPVDYGYLKGSSSMDGEGIDVWLGSDERRQIDAIVCTVDKMKRDSEIKILVGCTEEEKRLIYETHNNSEYMKGLLIRRSDNQGEKYYGRNEQQSSDWLQRLGIDRKSVV